MTLEAAGSRTCGWAPSGSAFRPEEVLRRRRSRAGAVHRRVVRGLGGAFLYLSLSSSVCLSVGSAFRPEDPASPGAELGHRKGITVCLSTKLPVCLSVTLTPLLCPPE